MDRDPCNRHEPLTRDALLSWLRERDPARIEALYREADEVRRRCVGDEIFLRGLIEFSNACERLCLYCGMRAPNTRLERYMMTVPEIMACVDAAVRFGYGTVVLQSGESAAMPAAWMAELVERIKAETPLAVTLSLGERPVEDLARWRTAGADRYLLRFETSNRTLFERIHPRRAGTASDRIGMLRLLRDLGYEVGSGVMVGIPGQTYDDLANDILLFRELDLDMIGIGPWIAHPDTPLGNPRNPLPASDGKQVPNTEEMVYRAMALTRMMQPYANIPATSALATLNRERGRELGMERGANIIMPILTPVRYRELYQIYPGKVCIDETARQCFLCLQGRIESIGRTVGTGPGASPNHARRRRA